MKILEVTDSFNLSRESVFVPLVTSKEGEVKVMPDQRLNISVPEGKEFEEWLAELRGMLAKTDLSRVRG